MISLLGALLGILSSIFPELLKIYRDTKDKAHELLILDMQLKAQREGHTERMAEISAYADIAEMASLGERVKPIGIRWVDALNGSVRPILTYAFFVLYAAVKVAQWHILMQAGQDAALPWLSGTAAWANVLVQLWTEEDQAIFAGIISFYFGSRAMSKVRGR